MREESEEREPTGRARRSAAATPGCCQPDFGHRRWVFWGSRDSARRARFGLDARDRAQGGDAARVEAGARLVDQQRHGAPGRPGAAVDAGRDERVPDVGDREDAGLEVDLVAAQAVRVAGAVEALVVAADGTADLLGVAELASELARPAPGWRLMTSISASVSRPGLVRIASGVESLPMSCSSPASARSRRRPGASPRCSPICTAHSATRRVCSSVETSLASSRAISTRTRAPRNASSSATSAAAGRSPTSGCDGRAAVDVQRDRDADQRRRRGTPARGPSTRSTCPAGASAPGRARSRARRCRRPRSGRRARRVRA